MPSKIDFSKFVEKDTLDFFRHPVYFSSYFSSDDWAALFVFFTKHPEIKRIKNLNLKHIDVTYQTGCTDGLKQNTTLTSLSLDLSFQRISIAGAKSIANVLKQNTTLTSLKLCWVDIDDDAQYIADMLKQNTTLRSLDLSYNKINSYGAQYIADMLLKQNTTLTSLNLSYNGICNYGAKSIADALQQNTTLRSLDLKWNEIGNDGAQSIADALKQNTTLTSLYLGRKVDTNSNSAKSIEKVLKKNMIMMSLNPDYNFNSSPLTDEDKKMFKEYREELLQHMDDRFINNPIGRKKANDAIKDPTTRLGQVFTEENITVFGTTVWNKQSDIDNQIMRFFHPQSPELNRERVFLDEEDILQNDCGL